MKTKFLLIAVSCITLLSFTLVKKMKWVQVEHQLAVVEWRITLLILIP